MASAWENEVGYSSHDVSQSGYNGSTTIESDLVNVVYDIPLGETWSLSLGGRCRRR